MKAYRIFCWLWDTFRRVEYWQISTQKKTTKTPLTTRYGRDCQRSASVSYQMRPLTPSWNNLRCATFDCGSFWGLYSKYAFWISKNDGNVWSKNLVKVCNGAEPSCPCAHYEGLWGSGGPDPLILNLGSGRWLAVGFTPLSLLILGAPRYPLNMSLDGS